MLELKGDVYPCMGCRSFLTPDRVTKKYGNVAKAKNYDGKKKYYGRLTKKVGATLNGMNARKSGVEKSANGEHQI